MTFLKCFLSFQRVPRLLHLAKRVCVCFCNNGNPILFTFMNVSMVKEERCHNEVGQFVNIPPSSFYPLTRYFHNSHQRDHLDKERSIWFMQAFVMIINHFKLESHVTLEPQKTSVWTKFRWNYNTLWCRYPWHLVVNWQWKVYLYW